MPDTVNVLLDDNWKKIDQGEESGYFSVQGGGLMYVISTAEPDAELKGHHLSPGLGQKWGERGLWSKKTGYDPDELVTAIITVDPL